MMSGIGELLVLSRTFLPMLLNLFFKYVLDLSGTPGFDIRIKDKIYFFEGSPCRFRISEENLESHRKTENSEDNICPPLDVGKSGCHEVRESKVENPVCCCRETDTFGAVFEGEDF